MAVYDTGESLRQVKTQSHQRRDYDTGQLNKQPIQKNTISKVTSAATGNFSIPVDNAVHQEAEHYDRLGPAAPGDSLSGETRKRPQ